MASSTRAYISTGITHFHLFFTSLSSSHYFFHRNITSHPRVSPRNFLSSIFIRSPFLSDACISTYLFCHHLLFTSNSLLDLHFSLAYLFISIFPLHFICLHKRRRKRKEEQSYNLALLLFFLFVFSNF